MNPLLADAHMGGRPSGCQCILRIGKIGAALQAKSAHRRLRATRREEFVYKTS
jgi:hypothetical protein